MFFASNHAPTPEQLPPAPPSAGDIDKSLGLLRTACNNRAVHKALERLLSQPTEQRQALVRVWVSDMLANKASCEFIHAVASLAEDSVADRAYEAIFGHPRETLLARLRSHH